MEKLNHFESERWAYLRNPITFLLCGDWAGVGTPGRKGTE